MVSELPPIVNCEMLRRRIDWTQDEAAAFFGVTARTWRKWEREVSPPTSMRRFLWLFERLLASKDRREINEMHDHIDAGRL